MNLEFAEENNFTKMHSQKLNIVVLISGNGSNLQVFIDRADELNIAIAAVISNRADAFGLERAKKAHIPAVVIDHTQFDLRQHFDEKLASTIQQFKPELIALAGFMRILSVDFINKFTDKIINIHPSLLPKYKGLDTHQRAIEANDKVHGASVHLVTAELDDGPVIIQGQLSIQENDTVESLQQKVHRIEYEIYPQAIKWLANHDIKIDNGHIYEQYPLKRIIISQQ